MKSLLQRADAPFLTRDQSKTLTDRVLGMARADETRVSLATGWSGNTRFAGAEITTSGGVTDTSLTVTSTIGRRRASATTNVLDDASLRRTVDLAERLARFASLEIEHARRFLASQRALGARDRVLSTVAHDLRSPLNVIMLAAGFIAEVAGADSLERTNADRIVRAAERARAMKRPSRGSPR